MRHIGRTASLNNHKSAVTIRVARPHDGQGEPRKAFRTALFKRFVLNHGFEKLEVGFFFKGEQSAELLDFFYFFHRVVVMQFQGAKF